MSLSQSNSQSSRSGEEKEIPELLPYQSKLTTLLNDKEKLVQQEINEEFTHQQRLKKLHEITKESYETASEILDLAQKKSEPLKRRFYEKACEFDAQAIFTCGVYLDYLQKKRDVSKPISDLEKKRDDLISDEEEQEIFAETKNASAKATPPTPIEQINIVNLKHKYFKVRLRHLNEYSDLLDDVVGMVNELHDMQTELTDLVNDAKKILKGPANLILLNSILSFNASFSEKRDAKLCALINNLAFSSELQTTAQERDDLLREYLFDYHSINNNSSTAKISLTLTPESLDKKQKRKVSLASNSNHHSSASYAYVETRSSMKPKSLFNTTNSNNNNNSNTNDHNSNTNSPSNADAETRSSKKPKNLINTTNFSNNNNSNNKIKTRSSSSAAKQKLFQKEDLYNNTQTPDTRGSQDTQPLIYS